MYFPYLRGKQFELIVLREISEFAVDNSQLSPIIEPVKETTVTLIKSLQSLIQNNQNFNLIINPIVGSIKHPDEILRIIRDEIGDYDNFQPSVVINETVSILSLTEVIEENALSNLSVICNGLPKSEEEFFRFLAESDIKYVILNEAINSKRFVRNVRKQIDRKISLSNPFKLLRRNVDYRDTVDEFFSDEHLFFDEDGYQGFADYLTIGDEYTDSGFLPYAVAIHLTYMNDDDEFWIRHFVSDSNEDTTDVAGKFGEALEKLIDFINAREIDSFACQEFRKLHSDGSYPGLGVPKKLSLKHHMELVYNFLMSR